MTVHSRYSHHARRALTHARLLVTRLQHPLIDTAHLLVGVMLTKGSIGYRVLADLELDSQQAEWYLRELYPQQDMPLANPEHAPALDEALALAADESAWLSHHYIGTEHLLLGITRTNAGEASQLLRQLGASSEQLRRRVRRALSEGETELELNRVKRDARLSELSRRVINAAEQMAIALDHPTVGLGHLLLVLSLETRSPTATLLQAHGLNPQRLNDGLKVGDPLLLPSIEGLLSHVLEEAEKVGSHYTGTEHLLLTLTLDPAGVTLLLTYGIQPDILRRSLQLGGR